MRRDELLILHGTDYRQMTKDLLEAADLIGQIPSRSCRIRIKPNLVSPTPASYGATTHPEIVAGILEYLQGYGCTNLAIMEGSWVGARTREAWEVCGYRELSRRYGVPLIDTQKEPSVHRGCAGVPIDICRCAAETDFLINVPVVKGHCQTKITCALKNLKGLIPNREKRRFHAMGLHRPIAHLNAGIRQDFILADNICGDLDCEDGGNPVVMNRLFAALDPVLCDAFVCYEMHVQPSEVPYIGMAERLGVGSADLNRLRLRYLNEPAGTPAERRDRKLVELHDLVDEVESCSACYGCLIPALDRLREEGLLAHLDTRICIGQGYRGRSGGLGIGNCTSGFAHFLAGCPPTDTQIYEFLKDYLRR